MTTSNSATWPSIPTQEPAGRELADRIAKVYNACGWRLIYFDGSRGA